MSTIYPAVLAQIKFACAVNSFVRELLKAVLPGLSQNKSLLGSDEQFQTQLDAALLELAPQNSDEIDYRRAVASASCNEVANLCELLTEACRCVGFDEAAKRYLSPKRFMLLVLRQDAAMLNALGRIVRSGDDNVGRLLMRVGAVLDGRPDFYDQMDDAAKRKATDDAQMIIAKVETLALGFDTINQKLIKHKTEIVEHVDAVGAKVDKIKTKRKRKSRHSETQHDVCRAYWEAANKNAEVRHSINTRITYESVFRYYSRELAKSGITSVKKFRSVLHAAQSHACEERKRALEAKREAERKAKGKTKPCSQFINYGHVKQKKRN